MTTEDKLKPCPVCGGTNLYIEVDPNPCGADTYGVVCNDCDILTRPYNCTREEAVREWNELPRYPRAYVPNKNWEE